MASVSTLQAEYKQILAAGKTAASTDAARREDLQSHRKLKELSRRSANRVCADCAQLAPGWASLPHGVFICMDCAQVHRHIGRHISQVKAFNTGTYLWYPHEMKLMINIGNDTAARHYCAKADAPAKPAANASRAEKERYIRDKYEAQKWTSPVADTASWASPVADTASGAATPAVSTKTAAPSRDGTKAELKEIGSRPSWSNPQNRLGLKPSASRRSIKASKASWQSDRPAAAAAPVPKAAAAPREAVHEISSLLDAPIVLSDPAQDTSAVLQPVVHDGAGASFVPSPRAVENGSRHQTLSGHVHGDQGHEKSKAAIMSLYNTTMNCRGTSGIHRDSSFFSMYGL